jgi:hypothetical protein
MTLEDPANIRPAYTFARWFSRRFGGVAGAGKWRYILPMTKERIERCNDPVYVLSDEERSAIADARNSRLMSEDEVTEFWKSRGIAI